MNAALPPRSAGFSLLQPAKFGRLATGRAR